MSIEQNNTNANIASVLSTLSNLDDNIYFNVNSHLKLVLCAKSQLSFESTELIDDKQAKKNEKFNLKLKMLFRDSTAYIECACYNSIALALNKLTLKKQYILRNFRLNYLQVDRKEWPEQHLNVSYEIIVNNMNCIMPSEQASEVTNTNNNNAASARASSFVEPLPPEPVISTSMFKLVDTRRHYDSIRREHGSQHMSRARTASLLDDALLSSGDIVPPKFTSMHEIHNVCKIGSVINTFGVIEKLDSIKHIKKPNQTDYELLNIYINDTTDHVTRVSMWNKQATSFAHSIGTVMMMFDLEVCTFNNESTLNVTRSSHYINIEASYGIDRADAIRKWYLNKCETKS